MVKITIDAAKALAMLKYKAVKLKSQETETLFKVGLYLQGEVKASIAGQRNEPTSVDTGRFLNSVDIDPAFAGVRVYSDVEYAKFLEYGTSKFNGRHHFTNTMMRNQSKVKEMVGQDVITSVES